MATGEIVTHARAQRGTSRMNASMIRNRYVGDSVATASPARLVTMLYDRLVRDLATGEAALAVSDLAAANAALVHAQDVVWELAAGLDSTKWSGGPALVALSAAKAAQARVAAAGAAKPVPHFLDHRA